MFNVLRLMSDCVIVRLVGLPAPVLPKDAPPFNVFWGFSSEFPNMLCLFETVFEPMPFEDPKNPGQVKMMLGDPVLNAIGEWCGANNVKDPTGRQAVDWQMAVKARKLNEKGIHVYVVNCAVPGKLAPLTADQKKVIRKDGPAALTKKLGMYYKLPTKEEMEKMS